MTSTTKTWYTRRRYWALALLALLVYFCLIPSPLRISPETTGYTEPLLPNGDVDYFAVYEKMYIDKLSPPEDNGYRLLLAACGPRILEQNSMMNKYSWEELPTGEFSKQWFHEMWIPLCEHMYIDPYVKPKFLDNPDYYAFMRKEWEANNKDSEVRYDYKEDNELHQKLAATPWTAEEYPVVARWLEQRTPVLDLFAVAVRKPNFVCWRWRPEGEYIYMMLLPDAQAIRIFARDLQVRVTCRLGKGDIDGAWNDVMSMFYLSRKHYINDPILVINLLGFAIEEMGLESAKLVLQYGNPTAEQLERFAKDLDSLPRKLVRDSEYERQLAYAGLQYLQRGSIDDFYEAIGSSKEKKFTDLTTFFLYLFGGLGDGGPHHIPRYVALLPFDRNIAGKRITKFLQTERRITGDSTWNINSTVRKKIDEEMEQAGIKKGEQVQSLWSLWRVPLIHTRSQLMGDYMISLLFPALRYAQEAHDRANTRLELLRMMVALERYKSDNENYPETLDVLIPKYLEEVPLDPFTGRLSWTYKLAPDAETAVLLHSSEWDASRSDKASLCVRIAK